ncbi:DUF664 domain-containing protein [Micromonospora sp. DT228]|uniref:mycothiol transferase n=1 Tax=Micromonospora sp. DT228 TaxID=3393443 RepID=UPI003CF0FB5C
MTNADEHGHPEPPIAGDETATLLGSLDRQRATLAWKTGGLDADGLRATLGPSSITLGGLLKHLALVEDLYFSLKLAGRSPGPPWETVDWAANPAGNGTPPPRTPRSSSTHSGGRRWPVPAPPSPTC